MVKEKYLINEVAKEVHVESHVLRYWEEELELPIQRNEQGHRVYTDDDIYRFIRIKELKDKGFQLKAVRTFLDNMEADEQEVADMRMDNPFSQKQLTKITKNGDMKMIQLKSTGENKWKENLSNRNMIEVREKKVNIPKVEKHELAIQIKDMNEIEDVQKEQSERLQYLFQKLIKEAVAENNAAMTETLVERITENVKKDLCKELDYQFRIIEERDEFRYTSRQEADKQRDEEYYRRLDELLRKYNNKGFKAIKEDKKKKNEITKADINSINNKNNEKNTDINQINKENMQLKDRIIGKEIKQKIFFWKKDEEDIKRNFKLVEKTAKN